MTLHVYVPIQQEIQGGIVASTAPVTQVQATLDTGDIVNVTGPVSVGDLVLSNPNTGIISVIPAASIASSYQQVR